MSMLEDTRTDDRSLDAQVARCLPEEVRRGIERQYYARIDESATLDRLAEDPAFLANPGPHMALWPDHGTVHVRDVARQVLRVLDTVHDVLVPRRAPARFEFMKAYGVTVAYVHDIGMTDLSRFGRRMHPEIATQEVFSPRFDDWVGMLWDENCGNMAWRLLRLSREGALAEDPRRVLREMLAMANCHSKSAVAVAAFSDREALREVMQLSLGLDIGVLYHRREVARAAGRPDRARAQGADPQGVADLERALEHRRRGLAAGGGLPGLRDAPSEAARRHYDDFEAEAYAWLVSPHPEVQRLVADVVDSLRAVRCADALRQRGTVLRTSAAYEILVDRRTASAVFALRRQDGQTFLVEVDAAKQSGEANVASSEVTRDGDLRVAFQRGTFRDPDVVQAAAHYAAVVVDDIAADAVDGFVRHAPAASWSDAPARPAETMDIILEGVDDNPEFAHLVAEELVRLNPTRAGRVRTAPSLQSVPEIELARYLHAVAPEWDEADRLDLLARMEQNGSRVLDFDPEEGFADVKRARLKPGEVLLSAGTPEGFVYVPLGPGLRGSPLGGYASFDVPAWVPLGNVSVVRGACRNATIWAECGVTVLIIPKETYLRHWHAPYTLQEFAQLLAISG